MKTRKNKLLFGVGLFLLSLTAIVGLNSGTALAATVTWDGGGEDDNFSTAANWSGDTTPVSGDSIVLPLDTIFSNCVADVTLTNDLNAASVTLAGIGTSGSQPENCSRSLIIGGNTIKSSGDIGNSDSLLTLSANIEAAGDITITGIRSTGGLNVGSHDVVILGSRFDGGASGAGTLILRSWGGGAGGCDVGQATPYPIAGDSSSFSGTIALDEDASISITSRESDIARHAAGITSNDGYVNFSLDNGSSMTFSTPLTINGGRLNAYQLFGEGCTDPTSNKKVTINSDVTLTAETITYLNHADMHFAGKINGKKFIKVSDGQTGVVTFADGDKIESAVAKYSIDKVEDCYMLSHATVINRMVTIGVDCTKNEFYKYENAAFPLEVRGIINGTGKIGHVKVFPGGMIAPGQSPGTLTTASIEWEEGGIYEFEIGKDAADQIKVLGTVKLGSGTLNVVLLKGAKPVAGKQYVIIDNDGKDAVSGTFKGLPEGATLDVDGYVYQISYKGGDGNDVVLTVKEIPKTPDTGFGMFTNNPLLTLAITTGAAGSILAIAKRRTKLAKKA